MEVDKLEPLLKLNTSTHIFSLFFCPPLFFSFPIFCASRNLFLLFRSSPSPPFQVDSTKIRQTRVSIKSNLICFLPTHRELKLCTRSGDVLDSSHFQCTVMVDAGVYCPLSVLLDFLFQKDCFSYLSEQSRSFLSLLKFVRSKCLYCMNQGNYQGYRWLVVLLCF